MTEVDRVRHTAGPAPQGWRHPLTPVVAMPSTRVSQSPPADPAALRQALLTRDLDHAAELAPIVETACVRMFERVARNAAKSAVVDSCAIDLADALIDAGYEIRIDAAAEDMRDSPSEIRVPLSTQNAGKPQGGKQYVQTLTYQLQ